MPARKGANDRPEKKSSKSAEKKAPRGKSAKHQGSGGGMFRLLFYLAVLGGVGYAALRVPIGGKTAFQHVREMVKWDEVAKKGAEVGKAAKDAVAHAVVPEKKGSEKASEKAPEKATHAPAHEAHAAKTPTKVADARTPPHAPEHLTKSDRDALDRLVR